MNRITNAFAAAIPSASGSDASSIHLHHRDASHIASPLEAPFPSHSSVRTPLADRRNPAAYDDPRTIYYPPTTSMDHSRLAPNSNLAPSSALPFPPGISRPARPTLLRRQTDDTLYRSQCPTPRGRSESRERGDRGVRVNLMAAATATRRGWGMNSATGTTRLNRMAEGPDGKYAIGGGQYLRVFQLSDPASGSTTPLIQDDGREKTLLARGQGGATISEVVNLWKPNWPVGKGVNDVDWGVAAWDNKLVTAAPSGYFMLFDVEKGKLEKEISSGSFRPLNCAQFCHQPSYCHMVLIGGTDGNIKLLDLRTGDPPSRRPLRHSSAITSVCFSPIDPSAFVVGLDDGTIKRYDWRMAGKHMGTAYGAHGSKAVMDLKWKTGEDGGAGWLASAGANKIVQIWDMNQSWEKAPTATHSLHTAHPVRRIAWRPNHPTELLVVPLTQPLSSANSLDPASPSPSPAPPLPAQPSSSSSNGRLAVPSFNNSDPEASVTDDSGLLEVWHVRRHYIAKYAIPSQDGVAVDASWRGADDLVVAFQNGGFAQLDIHRKIHSGRVPLPLEQVPRQVVAWSAKGELVYAVDRFRSGEVPFDDLKPEYMSHFERLNRPAHSLADPPYLPLQAIGFLPLPDPCPSEFAFLAKWYRLESMAPAGMCAWNMDVATWCGREDDARLWGLVKGLFDEFMPGFGYGPGQEIKEKEERFENDVFRTESMSKKPTTTTPPPVSPTGGAVRALPVQDAFEAGPSDNASHSPIMLQRVPSPHSPFTFDEGASTDRSSSSSAFSSDGSFSDDEEPAYKSRSRFISFKEPDLQGVVKSDSGKHQRQYSSSSSQGSPTIEEPNPNDGSSPAVAHTSVNAGSTAVTGAGTGPANLLGTGRNKHSLTKTALNSRPHAHVSSSEWPDPYGIIPEQSFSGATTGYTTATMVSRVTSSRSSPILMGKHVKNSPRATSLGTPAVPLGGLAGYEIGSGVVEAPSGPRGSGSGDGPSIIALSNESGDRRNSLLKEMRGKEDKFEKKEWERYKKLRLAGFIAWWNACVDSGELQLATTIALVASPLTSFPPFQLERLAHAYVELLERHRLPLSAAYIRQFSAIPSLKVTAKDQGMTHPYHCERCGKSTGSLEDIGVEGKVFWWCKRCRLGAKRCAVCRKGVKGLWMGCRKCGHGGHQTCMRLYHGTAQLVPLNCLRNPSHHRPALATSHNSARETSHTSLGPSVSGMNASAISGFTTMSSTEVSHHDSSTEKTDEEREGGYTLCPRGCGCRCRRVGPISAEAEN